MFSKSSGDRFRPLAKSSAPGPGAYELPQIVGNDVPAITGKKSSMMGDSKRVMPGVNKDSNPALGPGAYQIEAVKPMISVKKCSVSMNHRSKKVDSNGSVDGFDAALFRSNSQSHSVDVSGSPSSSVSRRNSIGGGSGEIGGVSYEELAEMREQKDSVEMRLVQVQGELNTTVEKLQEATEAKIKLTEVVDAITANQSQQQSLIDSRTSEFIALQAESLVKQERLKKVEAAFAKQTTELDELNSTHLSLQASYTTLASKLQEFQSTWSKAEEDHEGLKEEHDSLKEEHESLKGEYEELEEECRSTKQHLEAAEVKLVTAQKEHSTLQSRLVHMQQEAKEDGRRSADQIAELNSELLEWHEKSAVHEAKAKDLESKLKQEQTKHDETTAKMDELVVAIKDGENAKEKTNLELANAKDLHAQAIAKIQEMQIISDAQSETIQKLQSLQMAAAEKESHLTTQLAQLQSQHDSLAIELTAAKEAYAALQSTFDLAQNSWSSEKAAKASFVTKLQAQLNQLEQQRQEVTEKYEAESKDAEVTREQLIRAKSLNADLTQCKLHLESSLSEAQVAIAQIESTKQNLSDQIDQLQSRLDSTELQMREKMERMNELESQLQGKNETLGVSEQTLQETTQKLEKLQIDREQLSNHKISLENQLQACAIQIDDQSSQLTKLETERTKLNAQVIDYERQIENSFVKDSLQTDKIKVLEKERLTLKEQNSTLNRLTEGQAESIVQMEKEKKQLLITVQTQIGTITQMEMNQQELTLTIQDQTTTIATVEAKKQELVATIASIEREKVHLSSVIAERDASIEHQSGIIISIESKNADLIAVVASRDTTITEQIGTIASIETEKDKLNAIIAERDAKIAEQSTAITAVQREKDHLVSVLAERNSTIEEQITSIDAIKKAHQLAEQDWMQKIAAVEAKIEAQEATMEQMKQNAIQLSSDITVRDTTIDAQSATITQRDVTIEQQITSITILSSTVETQSKEISVHESANQISCDRLTEQAVIIERQAGEIHAAIEESASFKARYEKAMIAIETLKLESSEKDTHFERVVQEKRTIATDLEQAQFELTEKAEFITNSSRDLHSLRDQLARSISSNDALQSSNSDLRSEMAELQGKWKDSQELLHSWSNRFDKEQQSKVEWKSKHEDASQSLIESTARLATAEAEIVQLKEQMSEIDTLRASNSAMASRFASVSSALSDAQSELSVVKQSLHEAESDLTMLGLENSKAAGHLNHKQKIHLHLQIKNENNQLRNECTLFKQEIHRLTNQLKKAQTGSTAAHATNDGIHPPVTRAPLSGIQLPPAARVQQAVAGFGLKSVRKSLVTHGPEYEEVEQENRIR